MSTLCRPACAEDLPRIMEWGRKFWSQTAYAAIPFCPESLHAACNEMMSVGTLFVVTTEASEFREPVGALGFAIGPLYANKSKFVATELFWYIDPAARELGAGAALMAHGEREMFEAFGCTAVSMIALEQVSPAKVGAIYGKLGYIPAEHVYVKMRHR